jgi:hypothetical protein
MVTRAYTLEAYWDGGREATTAFAARLASFLVEVSNLDAKSALWFVAMRDELEQLKLDEPVAQLERGLKLQPEAWVYFGNPYTGCNLQLNNGRPNPERIELVVKWSAPKSHAGIWFPNRVLVDVRAPRPGLDSPEQLLAALECACRMFEPAWAVLGPAIGPPRDAEQELLGVPQPTWMTYLAAEYAIGAVTAEPASVRPVAGTDGGRIILATPDWFDPQRPRDVAAVEQVRSQLEASGALRPRTLPTESLAQPGA